MVIQIMLNLSYLEACPVVPYSYKQINILLVGCGGTGGYVAPFLARFAKFSKVPVRLWFIDPKPVREKNLIRQNFCPAELGFPKSVVLATRYNLAWGLEIVAIDRSFDLNVVALSQYGTLTLIVGCVDNAAARRAFNEVFEQHFHGHPGIWWLDAGNHYSSGQVAIGNAASPEPDSWFSQLGTVNILPAPSLQFPSLLEDLPDADVKSLSCEEIALREAQSQTINLAISSHVCDYVSLFFANKLTKFQTIIDMPSGSARSRYNSPQELEKFGKIPIFAPL